MEPDNGSVNKTDWPENSNFNQWLSYSNTLDQPSGKRTKYMISKIKKTSWYFSIYTELFKENNTLCYSL